MNTEEQSSPSWPKGVPQNLTGYEVPLFKILDETAANYPNQVYTVFQGAARTFRDVKDAADKVAGFLHSKGVKKGDRVLFSKYAGNEIEVDGKERIIMREDEILAIVG